MNRFVSESKLCCTSQDCETFGGLCIVCISVANLILNLKTKTMENTKERSKKTYTEQICWLSQAKPPSVRVWNSDNAFSIAIHYALHTTLYMTKLLALFLPLFRMSACLSWQSQLFSGTLTLKPEVKR